MNILGISAYYHDSSACLTRDGEIAAAAQEERFSRRKNTPDFPRAAINYCLQSGGITVSDLDCVAFYEKPFLKFARVLTGHIGAWPRSLDSFMTAMPLWLKDRLSLPLTLKDDTGYDGKVFYIRHHLSHAASAFLPSPFENAAIITADAVGEWATTSCGTGRGSEITLDREIKFPDSLGLLYTAVTTYLGFEAHEGEGKVMGLAGCGRPVYLEKFRRLAQVAEDGSYRLNQDYFSFYGGSRMYSPRLEELLGPARAPEGPLDERHADIAASLQKFTEDLLVRMARDLRARTGLEDLCLAGGVFLNCVANQKILENSGFRNLFIQPAAGDCGGALGAALYAANCLSNKPRAAAMTHACLGPEFSQREIERALNSAGLPAPRLSDGELFERTAGLLAAGRVTGWFQGRMEFGPRALGNRSILGDPRNPEMPRLLNDRVKHREPFRPYAPAVLEEKAGDYFELRAPSPFMLLAPPVRKERAGLIPAACHADGTARVQTVGKPVNPRFYALIEAFERKTGVPIVLNTSFNRRGEPVVCEPAQAIKLYLETEMDALALGNFLLEKKPAAGARPQPDGGGLNG
ncbi:MAG TPA: carbamoyltransferase N-terminal domain-containing protein [Elusimicrobiales bacterium]|nr:carbamoyltransferase N-terminal domain-containing protein [Elusimicrobiales bacterium]